MGSLLKGLTALTWSVISKLLLKGLTALTWSVISKLLLKGLRLRFGGFA
ncbi:hypothetical protein FWH09_00320 [Candidatus Saccharibacteria bacterium]|nr:hypothetical protein [Candidatus Saccharibacteria bacterium]